MTITAETLSDSPPVYRWRWAVLVVVLAAEIMDLLDATIINIAGPSIRDDLGGGYAFVQWLAAGYTLAFAVGLVTGGRLGDLFGRRRMFIIGAAGFTVCSLLCAIAPEPGALIVFRVLQGAFGAVLIPQGFGIVKEVFPPREAGAAFGAFGPVIGASAVAGPIVAGALVDADLFGTGWRMIFLINLPLGILAILGALRFMPRSQPTVKGQRLDLPGTALLTAGLVMLIYPLVQGREHGWPWWMLGLMIAAAPVLGVFLAYEQRRQRAGRAPLVEPSVLRKRPFAAGLLVGLILFAGLVGLMFVLGMHLQVGLGYSPLRAGLTLAPWALGIAIGAVAGHTLGAGRGRRILMWGVAVMATGVAGQIVTLHLTGTGLAPWQLLPALFCTGLGTGAAMTPYFDLVLAAVDEHEVGSASGTLNAAQQLGGAVGVAALATLFFSLLNRHSFTAAAERVMLVEVGVLVLTGALALLLPRKAREA
jgi:EmrB/QacA subfamily drug resistance transporter